MKRASLVLLRVSLGLFLVVWGGDRLVNPEHAVAVSEGFYGGLLSAPWVLAVVGVVEIVAGALIVAGVARRVTYPFLLLITTTGMLAVWRSILDPLELVMEGGNPVFFASLVIWAASIALWALGEEAAPPDRAREGRRPVELAAD